MHKITFVKFIDLIVFNKKALKTQNLLWNYVSMDSSVFDITAKTGGKRRTWSIELTFYSEENVSC